MSGCGCASCAEREAPSASAGTAWPWLGRPEPGVPVALPGFAGVGGHANPVARKVSAAPGGGASAEMQAAAQNAVVSSAAGFIGAGGEEAFAAYWAWYDAVYGVDGVDAPASPACGDATCPPNDTDAALPSGRFAPPEGELGCPRDGADGGCPSGNLDAVGPVIDARWGCEACEHPGEIDFPEFTGDSACGRWPYEDALRAAWCMLVENLDIVEWVLAMVTDDHACIGAVTSRLLNPSRVLLRCAGDSDPECTGAEFMHEGGTALYGFVITACTNQSDHDVMSRIVCCSPNAAERVAVIARLAGELLHELLHTCDPGFPGDESDNCECTYMADSTFVWAMAQRLPVMALAPCAGRGLLETSSDGTHIEGRDPWFMKDSASFLQSTDERDDAEGRCALETLCTS